MASPQPYWVEKELRTYNSAYQVWFQLGIADHVKHSRNVYIRNINLPRAAGNSGAGCFLAFLPGPFVAASFDDLFLPIFDLDRQFYKKKGKNSIGSYKSRTCDWKRADHCKGVWERSMNVCVESAVMSAVATSEYAYWRLILEAGVLISSCFIQDIVFCSLKWTNS